MRIFVRHHLAHMILVTSLNHPAMLTSAPVLDALKAEKSAHMEGVIRMKHSHLK